MATLPMLRFSHNWNNKLCCDYFTTIRLHNASRTPGIQLEVLLKDQPIGTAVIVEKVKVRMSAITDMMAYLDTGYSRTEARKIFRKMYPDQDDPMMDFTLLRWVLRSASPEQLFALVEAPEPEPFQLNLQFT
jgi:hypothetical protein